MIILPCQNGAAPGSALVRTPNLPASADVRASASWICSGWPMQVLDVDAVELHVEQLHHQHKSEGAAIVRSFCAGHHDPDHPEGPARDAAPAALAALRRLRAGGLAPRPR